MYKIIVKLVPVGLIKNMQTICCFLNENINFEVLCEVPKRGRRTKMI